MPRIAWTDATVASAAWHQVLGVIDQPPRSELGRDELREAMNLVFRSYTGLRLRGRYAVTSVRAGTPGVLSVIELDQDLAIIQGVIPLFRDPGTSRWQFLMTFDTLRQLEQVAVPPDTRATGRRERKRKEEKEHGEFSLRWW